MVVERGRDQIGRSRKKGPIKKALDPHHTDLKSFVWGNKALTTRASNRTLTAVTSMTIVVEGGGEEVVAGVGAGLNEVL